MTTNQTSQDDLENLEFPIGGRGQLLLAAWSIALLCGFGIAIYLKPDPKGFGTHQQLGLPPCTMKVLVGIPCPSCGMTTSFSNYVRGNFVAASQANPAGLLLAVLCTLTIPWCWASIVRRRLWMVHYPDRAFLYLMVLICSTSIIQWLIRFVL